MNVLSFLRSKNLGWDDLLFLDSELGRGYNGQIFNLKSCSDRVIKLGIIFDNHLDLESLDQKYEKVSKTLSFLEKERLGHFAKVYSHMLLDYCHADNIIYSYIMEKLFPLSEDEIKVFRTLVSHEDRNLIKKIPEEKAKILLNSLSKGLDFDLVKVCKFHHLLYTSNIKHHDLHERNIMKDNYGNYKLIDLDSVIIER